MMMMMFFVLLSVLVSMNSARQLSATDGTLLWIAAINDSYDCDDVTARISALALLGRDLSTTAGSVVIDQMKGDEDCFVEFSGDATLVAVIEAMDGVESVSYNEEVFAVQWNLDRADQSDLPLDGEPYMPVIDGTGQCVYLIDTGIYPDHSDFEGRASFGADFINEDEPKDLNGHGTHVASTATGIKYGIAPGTTHVVGVKVLGASGSGSSAGVIKGIQWAVADANKNKKMTCVLSLSLGGGPNTALDKAAVDAAKQHFVVVAAGNSNEDACNTSPARSSGKVITVGSTTKSDSRSSFSNYGKCVDIFAPGSSIMAASVGGPSKTAVLSGTSMATPYIAGLALQALQKNDNNYMTAYDDLFASAVSGRVTDVMGTVNLLGVAFSYTGPPTPPTIQPTMPPSMPEPTLCRRVEKTGKYTKCVSFDASQFGTSDWRVSPMSAPIMKSKDRMCSPTNEDFSGKIALVERGDCLFFDKVKQLELQGAIGVIIYNDVKGSGHFPPAFSGTGLTKLPSCMIGYSDGTKILRDGDMIHWGSILNGMAAPTAMPTSRPTTIPSAAPTTLRCDTTTDKKECNGRNKCSWDGFVCYIRHKFQK